MKFLVVAYRHDPAGMNIFRQLLQFGKIDTYLCDKPIVFTENLDLEKINKYDFIIFASKHQSESKEKTLSVHTIGNWREANYGGERKKVSLSSAILFKQTLQELNKNYQESSLRDFSVTMEATHHGPLIGKPSLFIEIGSTILEWENLKAGFVIAKTISNIIQNFKYNQYNEVAIAIGGPHYCPNFNKIQLKSNIAISHIISSYALPADELMIQEALSKTYEEDVEFILLDWKGLGNASARQQLIDVLEKMNLRFVKTSDIDKG
ncbi:MAG: D-aminoacyl-tRNA deacylase [Nanoarchaeota archaeon]